MKKWIVDFHGSVSVEAENEEAAYEAAHDMVEAAKNEKEAEAIEELISVIQMDNETITEDIE